MSNQTVKQLLQGRYQIVQSLGAGVFGQTYIAEDVDYPERPRCVIKQLKVNDYQSSAYFDYLRLRFLTETETLKHLGQHNQIPQLITFFEENEQFYLVQEHIVGQPLSGELSLNQQRGIQWTAIEAMTFLEDALGILEFVHSKGFIHCDVKPENLIRRAGDHKLVLIDFGSIQPIDFSTDAELPISQIPVSSLGYIPPEQFLGQTQPNSDIYALGMIVLQALTGLTPLQLKIDPTNNEIPWRCEGTEIDEYLAVFINQMIRYNYQERFQSASEALWILNHITWKHQPQIIAPTQPSTSLKKNVQKKNSKSEPLLAGMRLGLALNSLVVGLGVSALVNNSLVYSETGTLSKAITEYQSGDLEKAINIAKSIPPYSNVYPEAQDTIAEWQKQWHIETENYLAAEQALNEGKLSDAILNVSQIPYTSYWSSKREKLVEKTQANLEEQSRNLLNQAYAKAENREFSAALEYLRQIPPETYAGTIVQQKLTEYKQKQQIRAGYFLHTAYKKALTNDFASAIKLLKKIPQDTEAYPQAQIKIQEYNQKLELRGKIQNIVKNSRVSVINQLTIFGQSDSDAKIAYFPSPDEVREVNIST
ncbi:serine/threonine protein kinase [Anabaena cylindrica FACHB-243]|uniref:non-specific serine/threonine protein kinase n=1 Tax=Anabaena cylindrica (strain ATCC 27899 / PCC 7122) TaxID=272123 RepID=K9ZL73_ANACC|nr:MULTISPECIES: serine/threonine-protein kinase [Anabaena]AFZ59993.1 serine/threonine protein kinase [Anabaena cylindrica PCC 7122]MBD2417949.1 serine/threonine protein kinase [Anabaena cylindrica FACHB-243]MBY5285524.1 serine/threonine protein kinase [Anabaena sp. CCAP 1446/1C]MBY5307029.1 serine/threonine protein kinase [Anabaena sp. CCAP 1446/1C]MCM2404865.1 serine/threonine protein kinase [Anabaena sp. CCAP 1446/1C]